MITETLLSSLREGLKDEMEDSRYRHTLGVEQEIRALARFFSPETEKTAAAAGLLHDITKGWTPEEHIAFCRTHGISVTEEERAIPALLHAKTAAALIPLKYPALATGEILSAVTKHTTADKDMSVLDALLYIADFTEAGRSYSSCQEVRRLLHEEMKKGTKDKGGLLRYILLTICEASLSALRRMDRPIASGTREAILALSENERYFS